MQSNTPTSTVGNVRGANLMNEPRDLVSGFKTMPAAMNNELAFAKC